jgi:gentisate 1,2-dioxygenase
LISGDDTAGRDTLIDMHVASGGGPPPHRHDCEEVFSVLEGEVAITFRDRHRVAKAGETVNVPANAPHGFHNASEHPARLLCLCAPPAKTNFLLRLAFRSRRGLNRRRHSRHRPRASSSPSQWRWRRSTEPSSSCPEARLYFYERAVSSRAEIG